MSEEKRQKNREYQKERRIRLKAKGVCCQCARRPIFKKTSEYYCRECLKYCADRTRERLQRKKVPGPVNPEGFNNEVSHRKGPDTSD